MRWIWKSIKWVMTISLILALMLTSAFFTVLLYAEMTGQPHMFSRRDHDPKIVYAEHYQEGKGADLVLLEEEEEPEEEAYIPAPSAMLDAPLVLQYPELPRGCEITSLTMLLQFYGFDVNKVDLFAELKRDPTPVRYAQDGSIYFWGHPNTGFVGDITLNSPGFGVYHAPLFELLQQYIPTAVDLTGESFDEIIKQVSKGIPVVVWTTTTYKEPPYWVEWDTPIGPIRTTHLEHAVLLTGYDEEYVYFNDPLKKERNIKVNKEQFIRTWEVMGKQAISYHVEDGVN